MRSITSFSVERQTNMAWNGNMKRIKQNNKRIKQIKSNMNKNVLIHQKLKYWIVGIDLLVNWTIFSWTVIVWVRERCTNNISWTNETNTWFLWFSFIQTAFKRSLENVFQWKSNAGYSNRWNIVANALCLVPKYFYSIKFSIRMVYRTRKSQLNNGIRCIGIERLSRKSFYIYFNLNK